MTDELLPPLERALRSDRTSAKKCAHLEMAYQFWPQRSSLAEVAKVFILAPPYDQMWHYWKDSNSQCSNVQSHSVVMKVRCPLCQLLRPLQQIHRSVGGGRVKSHVCLLLPTARLFVCLVLNVSTLAYLLCVGVESNPHLQGCFFLSRSPFFPSLAAEFES